MTACFAAETVFFVQDARAVPVQATTVSHKLTLRTRRTKGSGIVLKEGLKVGVMASALVWDYIPDTAISVPFVTIQLQGVPVGKSVTVLAARTGRMEAKTSDGYTLRIPLIKKDNSLLFTFIDASGMFEEWDVQVGLDFPESSIFVDENCKDYSLRIKELSRPAGPNLIFLGCKMGSRPQDLSLEMIWSDVVAVEYMSQSIQSQGSIMTIPLQSKTESTSKLTGIHQKGLRSVYNITYQPYLPPPYEVWGGLAFFRTSFEQANFRTSQLGNTYKYNQMGLAFMSQIWYRPDDAVISVMLRGFGTALSVSNNLDPVAVKDADIVKSSKVYFLDAELRAKVLDWKGWRIDPFFGGWFYFMKVDTPNLGVERIIDPVLGVVVQRSLWKRDYMFFTLRVVPLQDFFNPLKFSMNESYFEYELTYVHPFKFRNRVFVTMYAGVMKYHPPNWHAGLDGGMLLIGGGYGF